MLKILNKALQPLGYTVVKKNFAPSVWDMNNPADEMFQRNYAKASPYTMTSKERMYAMWQAVNYIVEHKIEGDVVECGVWKGGSTLMGALTLEDLADTSRDLYLFDTFEGMTAPTEHDTDYAGKDARVGLAGQGLTEFAEMCNASLNEVKQNLARSSYPSEKIHYVKGPVEETIPGTMPEKIALLRLDTDWYESTYHELVHLYPRLSSGGVLIIDDYGHWRGAREATDQYFKEESIRMLLSRIDDTGRLGVKE